jgi:hypothetical protein
MIEFLNDLINRFFKLLKYITIVVVVVYFLATYIIRILLYRWKPKYFKHPHFVLFDWMVRLDKWYRRFIL